MHRNNKTGRNTVVSSLFKKMPLRIRSYSTFLKFLYDADPRQRKVLIQSATSDQIEILSEIALNIYRGVLELSPHHIRKLKPYKLNIRALYSRSIGHRRKKNILARHPILISLLIKPVLSLLDEQ